MPLASAPRAATVEAMMMKIVGLAVGVGLAVLASHVPVLGPLAADLLHGVSDTTATAVSGLLGDVGVGEGPWRRVAAVLLGLTAPGLLALGVADAAAAGAAARRTATLVLIGAAAATGLVVPMHVTIILIVIAVALGIALSLGSGALLEAPAGFIVGVISATALLDLRQPRTALHAAADTLSTATGIGVGPDAVLWLIAAAVIVAAPAVAAAARLLRS